MTRSTCTMLFILGSLVTGVLAQSPPGQPATGPGGTEYIHDSLTVAGPYWAAGHVGDNSYQYFLFEPDAPKPAVAPVVLFLHGWLAYNPDEYAFWIAHMVRKGYVVVWAQYDQFLAPWNFAGRAMDTWLDALKRLDSSTRAHVRPERDGNNQMKTAIVGHSAGGYLGAILAVKATRWWIKLPQPSAIVAIEPGGKGLILGEDFSRIPSSTKMLVVVGDADETVCYSTATHLWSQTPQIARNNKDFLLVQSDDHGQPAQLATHFFPNTTGRMDTAGVDARDYFATWKLSVAALNCTFRGRDCDYAFGHGSVDQVDMGVWSDGVPMAPMFWVADPNLLAPSAECEGR